VPKVSEEHRERRREEILDAARRCFARHGYGGATVARLEEETGLSRGAIFNYFPSKDDLFMALTERDADRIANVWEERGFEGALEAIVDQDPAWLGVYVEALQRIRTDDAFRERWNRRGDRSYRTVGAALEEAKEAGRIRDDVPSGILSTYLGVVLDGLVLRAALGYPLPDREQLLSLVRQGVAPPP
jgi:AcrR family transcriptional regulator